MEAQKRIKHIKYISSATVAKVELTINDLDDDSLGIIFNNLPYRYRMDIENVCKRWRDVLAATWWSYSKHLTIDQDTFPSLHGYTPEKNQKILQKILKRGQYLEEITITGVDSQSFKGGTIKQIVGCCPMLKYLNINMLLLNSEDWFACSNLEGLSWRQGCIRSGDKLRELFCRNKRLHRLKIASLRTCTYTCSCIARIFDHLDPGQLEILHIVESEFEFTAELADKLAESLVELNYEPSYEPLYEIHHLQHLSKLKNLRTLMLNFDFIYDKIDTQFITDIAKNCKKLEHITLYFHDYLWDSDKLKNIYYNLINPNVIPLLFGLSCFKSLVLIIRSVYKIPYDSLFREAPNLKFLELCSSYNVKRSCNCYEYRRTAV